MKQEFIIKLQGKQHARGRGQIVFMLICFIVSLVILMIYSSKFFIALVVPVFYLILRLRDISAERTIFADAVCAVASHDFGVELSVKSMQSKLCETHHILYSNVNIFSVRERKVFISYTDNREKRIQSKIIAFYVLPEDAIFWIELAEKFSK